MFQGLWMRRMASGRRGESKREVASPAGPTFALRLRPQAEGYRQWLATEDAGGAMGHRALPLKKFDEKGRWWRLIIDDGSRDEENSIDGARDFNVVVVVLHDG